MLNRKKAELKYYTGESKLNKINWEWQESLKRLESREMMDLHIKFTQRELKNKIVFATFAKTLTGCNH